MNPIRILLVDDHSLLRLGLAALLKYQDGMEVVGSAENGEEALARVQELSPDVIVMDLMMPVMSGVEATRRIKALRPAAAVLILTTFGTAADVSRAVAAGASGALLKGSTDDELIQAIRAVARGGTAFSPEIEQLVREDPAPPELTERQREILESVARGLTNHDIAIQLAISTDAVNQHLLAIREKLGAANRAEAVAIALTRHLLKP